MTTSADRAMTWQKSSYSGTNGDCVEVAWSGGALVRDSKQANGPELAFPAGQWHAFLGTVG